MVNHRWTNVDGVSVFYRQAGDPKAPLVLMLHGFPSSSIQYRFLPHDFAERYFLIAPDYPAFGLSATPSPSTYRYTFDQLANTVSAFIAQGASRVSGLVLHDYGADIGFRLLERGDIDPEALVIIGSQTYLDAGWRRPMFKLYERGNYSGDDVRRSLLVSLLTQDGIRKEFMEQLDEEQRALIDPNIIQLAGNKIRQAEATEAMLLLHLDYKHNFERYETNQAVLRALKIPTSILWGAQDQYTWDPMVALPMSEICPMRKCS